MANIESIVQRILLSVLGKIPDFARIAVGLIVVWSLAALALAVTFAVACARAKRASFHEDVGTVTDDLEIKDQFSFHERCLQEQVCPRCCAALVSKSYFERQCPLCGFRHYNANPERKPHAVE